MSRDRRSLLPLVVLALAAAAVPALGQVRAGGEFRVNSFTTGAQSYGSIGGDPNGGFVVVWDHLLYPYFPHIAFGQRFDGAGNRVGAEFQANTTPDGRYPSVAVKDNGGFLVVWTTGTFDLHAQLFDAGASKVGAEFQVGTYTSGFQELANVVADPFGNFVVVWSTQAEGSGIGVSGQRLNGQGAPLGAEFRVNTYTTGYQYRGAVSTDAAGNFVVAWMSFPAPGDAYNGVFAQRYDSNGAALGANFLVNTFTTGDEWAPTVAHASDGSFVVAFHDFSGGGDVYVRRYDPSGQARGAEFRVNTTTAGIQTYPAVASDALGNFVVAWVDYDGDSWGVRAQRFRSDGAARGADFLVNTTTAGGEVQNRFLRTLDMDEVGNFVVEWTTNQSDVFQQRFGGLHPSALQVDGAGNRVWEPGETVEVQPAWLNTNGAAQSVSGTFSRLTGPPATYAITDAAAAYGTIGNGSVASCTDCYAVTANDASPRPAQHWDATAVEALTPDAQGQQKRWTLHIGASFPDVPRASGYYRFVETLLHRSVTAGCGGGNYCPGASTSRAQMAAFVLVSSEGPRDTPPACTTPVFGDVPASSPFCRWIEELARRGVTGGCGGGNYCPDDAVSREQMAVFLLRTLDPALDPPACGTPVFNDVAASSPFCKWIEELARRGITAGCGGSNFCPQQAVTREQMAVFLTTTFGLTLYGP